jgi:hypothetical protein
MDNSPYDIIRMSYFADALHLLWWHVLARIRAHGAKSAGGAGLQLSFPFVDTFVLRTSPSVLPMLTNLFRRGRIKLLGW